MYGNEEGKTLNFKEKPSLHAFNIDYKYINIKTNALKLNPIWLIQF